MDEATAAAQLDRILSMYSLMTVIDDIVIPYLVDLGTRWERGESTISEEHFATFVLRGRLMALARGWGAGDGPLALLGCAPGEDHDLGLICFGLGLRQQGWRIVMLGPNTPIETLEASASAMSPKLIVVTSASSDRLLEVRGELGELARGNRLMLGGSGATRELAEATGAEFSEGSPMRAAAQVPRESPA